MVKLLVLLLVCSLTAQADELTDTLRKLRDTGQIGLGVRDRSLPFGYADGDRIVGYGVDVCLYVVAAIERELHIPPLRVAIRPVNSVTRFSFLDDGTIDLDCGTSSNTIARHQQAAFSNTYFVTTMRYVSRRSAGLVGVEALRGKIVVSTANTTNLVQLERLNVDRHLGMEIRVAATTGEAFHQFQSGGADAFVADDVLIAALIATSPEPTSYAIDPTPLSEPEPYAIMMRKDDAPLKVLVDRATAALLQGPDGLSLYARWFEESLPGRRINLALPMSPALRKAFSQPTDSADPTRYLP